MVYSKNKNETFLMTSITFDGAARGNPGPSGAGAVLWISTTRTIHLGSSTNNDAEAMGVNMALELLIERVTILSDRCTKLPSPYHSPPDWNSKCCKTSGPMFHFIEETYYLLPSSKSSLPSYFRISTHTNFSPSAAVPTGAASEPIPKLT